MTEALVSKIKSFCNLLRDAGLGYGDYLEQLTYLLFLKMVDEYSKPPHNRKIVVPEGCAWDILRDKRGSDLENQYDKTLRDLSKQTDLLGRIFFKAKNKIEEPSLLYRLVQMIDRESWVMLGVDVKGAIYEDLLQAYAEDIKSGAGQYFTPRTLIKAIVKCVSPEPGKTIADPACGTGGFFLAAYDYLTDKSNYQLDKDSLKYLKYKTFRGVEYVQETARLCLMNLFLHNIGDLDNTPSVERKDSLIADDGIRYDYVLTNPPFGKKSSMTFTNEEGEEEGEDLVYNRQDFWATTSNKQLNFVQHIHTMLKVDGKAAVVVPDNVLFEGGAGETVRKKLLETTDLHTILRLPTGIFYKPGVKANVIFFDNRTASKNAQTKEVWIYDFRTNMHFTLKKNPLKFEDLKEFIQCYNPGNRYKRKETFLEKNPEGRWRKFTYNQIIARDKTSLDIFWLKDKSLTDLDSLPDPDDLATEIIENIEAGLESFKGIIEKMKG
jgi:type I restriction enzyme M protein